MLSLRVGDRGLLDPVREQDQRQPSAFVQHPPVGQQFAGPATTRQVTVGHDDVGPLARCGKRALLDEVAAPRQQQVPGPPFPFDAEQRELLASGPARLVVDHPEYKVWVELTDAQRAELARDFAD